MYFELKLLPGGRLTYVRCREYNITVLSFSCVQFLFYKHQANCLLIIFFVSNGFFLEIRQYKLFYNNIRLIDLDETSDAKFHSDFNSFEDKKGFGFDFMTFFLCVLKLN